MAGSRWCCPYNRLFQGKLFAGIIPEFTSKKHGIIPDFMYIKHGIIPDFKNKKHGIIPEDCLWHGAQLKFERLLGFLLYFCSKISCL